MDAFEFAVLSSAGALTATTAWTDWQRRQISLWTLAALLVLWGLSALVVPHVLGGPWAESLCCGAGGLALGFGLYAVGWLGGGDGKLLGVTGLWLGPQDFGLALLGASLLLLVLWVPASAGVGVRGGDFRNRGIPFACALTPPTVVILAARLAELLG